MLGAIDFTTVEVWRKSGLVTFYLLFFSQFALVDHVQHAPVEGRDAVDHVTRRQWPAGSPAGLDQVRETTPQVASRSG